MARQTEQHAGRDPGPHQTSWKAIWAAKTARFWMHISTNVREVERRAKMAGNSNLSAIKIPNAPIGELENFAEQVKLMYDLLALAYQADLTRVATYVTVAEGTNRNVSVPQRRRRLPPGFAPRGSSGAHREADQDPEVAHADVRRLPQEDGGYAGRTGLVAGPFAIFMYGSNMSNSNQHSNYPIPNLIVGGGNGKLKQGGQHLVLPERTPSPTCT